jgi:hypothetical protein
MSSKPAAPPNTDIVSASSGPQGSARAEIRDAETALSAYLRRLAPLPLVFLIQLGFFSPLALRRLIDSDEGFYLLISKLVVTHSILPYRDVFYQQMPLLPYLYGAWMRVFGFSWVSGRMFSAVLAAVAGTLLFHTVRKSTNRLSLAIISLLLYASNLSVLLFFLTAKTYVLSTLLLLGGVLLARTGSGRFRYVASGLLLALSIQTRLFFAAAAPAFFVILWRENLNPQAAIRRFASGMLIGFVPSLLLFLIAPRQFLFDNLIYHGLRDSAGLVGDLGQKLEIAQKLFLSSNPFRPTQFALLFVGLPLALVVWRKIDKTGRLGALLVLLLGFVSLLPTPTFGQYFCVLVPFLILCLMQGVRQLEDFLPDRKRSLLYAAFFSVCFVSAALAVPRVYSLFWKARDVPGLLAGDWRISTVENVASLVDSTTNADAPVVCSWPGYMLSTSRTIYPKMENQMSMGVSEKVTDDDAERLHILRKQDLRGAIADERVQTVVIGNCSDWWPNLYMEASKENGYKLLTKESNVLVLSR